MPLDLDRQKLPDDEVFLRIWSPGFTNLDFKVPVELTVKKLGQFSSAEIRRGDHQPVGESKSYEAMLIGENGPGDPQPGNASERHLILNQPISFPDKCAYERVYAFPADLVLEPQKEYSISGRVRDQNKNTRIFDFTFHTDSRGEPVAY